MYTGGTTGTSKGVAHSHRSAFAAMVNNTVAERIVPSDKYLLLGQMFHSACILALNYLNHGCPVVIIDFQPDLALQIIELERVTATLAFPSMAHHMVWAIGSGAHDLSSLRNVQYGGGPMPVNVILEMLRALPCNLIQCYGTTESIGITFLSQEDHLNAMREADSERLTSCGREALLTEVRLLDAKNQWIPPDSREPGELVLRSESNMLGYWNRPDLNRDAWHNDWLRTGDIARWGKDRFLYIVDRAKDIIISGGENIYSSQVEKAIYSHPSVLEAAVIGIPDLLWGESVKAFVVLKPGMGASEADIANAVARELASYQKPRYVEFVEAIPKTPAGKIAKQDLRKRSESLSHVANKA
jgi:long-chain acyl-CoA synthetase